MGAPTVMTEKLPQGDELMTAFRQLEQLLGRKIDAGAVRRGRWASIRHFTDVLAGRFLRRLQLADIGIAAATRAENGAADRDVFEIPLHGSFSTSSSFPLSRSLARNQRLECR